MILPSALRLPIAHSLIMQKKKKSLNVGSTFLVLLKIVSGQIYLKQPLGGVVQSIGATFITFLLPLFSIKFRLFTT